MILLDFYNKNIVKIVSHYDEIFVNSGVMVFYLLSELAKKNNIPVVHVLDEYGKYIEGQWLGEDVWEINKTIAKTLHENGIEYPDYGKKYHSYNHEFRSFILNLF